jgi:16S rRNA G1207 methylase RsmC
VRVVPDDIEEPQDTPPDHYFSAEPASAEERRSLQIRLAGRDITVRTASGIFSPGRIDLGTQVLLRTAPAPPATGHLLDLGCGWGPLALTLALRSPDAQVWAVDVNNRALDLLRGTARDLGLSNVVAVRPDEVPASLLLDALWSNPPIRVGKEALHGMLRAWLPRLAPGAEGHLVVQRNLGADSLQRWIGDELELAVERMGSAKGFRVLRVTH